MRRLIALAVVLLHVLLLALLMSGVRVRMLAEPAGQVFVSLWLPLEPPIVPQPVVEQRPVSDAPDIPRSSPPARATEEPAVSTTPAESTAITPPAIAPAVDWGREATLAARRAADQSGKEAQTTFSPPPKTLPEPCKPKKSSMEMSKGSQDVNSAVTWVGPLPVVKVGKRCIVTIGFFACNLSELPETNSHLLDDMRKPDRQESSVPHPNICD